MARKKTASKLETKKNHSNNKKGNSAEDGDLTAYSSFIQHIADRYTTDLLSKEEIESFAWEGAWYAFRTYDPQKGTALKSWIFTKANGAIKDALRKEHARRSHESQSTIAFFDSCVAGVKHDEPCFDEIEKQRAVIALSTMDERTRDIILRHFLKGQTQECIAKDMGITQSWCSRLFKRGLAQLKCRLED